jgi:hypothetical protein
MVKKTKPTIAEACQTCRFLLIESARDEIGFCRRYPPKLIASEEELNFTFPVVAVDEWCGEYRGPEQ